MIGSSSFSLTKGSLIPETYRFFAAWDPAESGKQNFSRARDQNLVGARSASWLRDVLKVIHSRFELSGRDRPLLDLARQGVPLDVWKPILLWHLVRQDTLLRAFLTDWLWSHHGAGTLVLRTRDVAEWLTSLDLPYAEVTRLRVASALLRLGVDFGLLTGTVTRRFAPVHLPEPSLLYLLHAIRDAEGNTTRLLHSPDWRCFYMAPEDVESAVLRLHQFRRLHYEVAGSVVDLSLPAASAAAWVAASAA